MRQPSFSAEASSPGPRSPGTPTGSPSHRPGRGEELSELEGNYLEYLRDARLNIDRCVWACRVWSAPYDGEEPSASSLAPAPDPSLPVSSDCLGYTSFHAGGHPGPAPTSPRTKKRGPPEEVAVLKGASGGLQPSPSPRTQDSSVLLNGALADPSIKKVRWCPPGAVGLLQNGSTPSLDSGPAWEPPPHPEVLLEEEWLPSEPAENGAASTLERFTVELRQLEEEMHPGSGAQEPPVVGPPPDPDPLSQEEEEAYQRFASPAGSVVQSQPTDPLAQVLSSPPRAPGQPPSQPFTGEPVLSAVFPPATQPACLPSAALSGAPSASPDSEGG